MLVLLKFKNQTYNFKKTSYLSILILEKNF